jgi:hypothetical protein
LKNDVCPNWVIDVFFLPAFTTDPQFVKANCGNKTGTAKVK